MQSGIVVFTSIDACVVMASCRHSESTETGRIVGAFAVTVKRSTRSQFVLAPEQGELFVEVGNMSCLEGVGDELMAVVMAFRSGLRKNECFSQCLRVVRHNLYRKI